MSPGRSVSRPNRSKIARPGELERAEVDGDAHAARHRKPASGVHDDGRAVLALLDVAGVGGLDERRQHLVGDGDQRVAHHLDGDRIEPDGGHFTASGTGGAFAA